MKEKALALARGAGDPDRALNLLREYLQALILRSLHENEAFRVLVFVGGTALRFLYNLPRFSEDLDFSLVDPAGYAGREWLVRIKRDLVLGGFEPEVAWNDRKNVHVAWVRLAGILREAGISSLPTQKLAVKVEIDTRPPDGGRSERRVVTRHLSFLLRHHDLSSLMAGKIHAMLSRRYAKGRDCYDLMWYLSHRPPVTPDALLLQNALDQTAGHGRHDALAWRALLRERLAEVDSAALVEDARPFLEDPRDARLLTVENLLALLGEKAPG